VLHELNNAAVMPNIKSSFNDFISCSFIITTS
jgi:hypothetical protein